MHKSREKKFQHLISLMPSLDDSSILDVGPANVEYSPFDNYFEKRYSHPENITALSNQDLSVFKMKYPQIETVQYQGDIFPFRTKEFSVVISNAVIEHVGGYDDQVQFVRELNRVGHRFYFTTPAKEFPLEIHTNLPFVHWFSKPICDRLLTCFGRKWASGDFMNLLSRRSLRKILEGAGIGSFEISLFLLGPLPLHYLVWGE